MFVCMISGRRTLMTSVIWFRRSWGGGLARGGVVEFVVFTPKALGDAPQAGRLLAQPWVVASLRTHDWENET